jgi:ABC-2 type transport system permease protein
MIRTELKLFLRDPAAFIVGLGLAPVILVILGSVPVFRTADPDVDGARLIDLYVPVLIAMALALTAISTLPTQVVTYRERGILRRFATTPVTPATVLAAQLITYALMALAAIAAILVVSALAFDVPLPRNPAGFALALLLSGAALFGLGLLLSARVRTARLAGGLGSLLFFPLMFFAGLWVPRAVMPGLLRQLSDYTPLGAGVQALLDSSAGHWPSLLHLVVLAGWAVVTTGLAVRWFCWE